MLYKPFTYFVYLLDDLQFLLDAASVNMYDGSINRCS